MHITITSSPAPNLTPDRRRVEIHHDLQLLKAGLLYGDRVTLCSMPAKFLAACLRADVTDAKDRARFLEELAPTLPSEHRNTSLQAAALLREFARTRRGRYRSTSEILKERRFLRQMNELWPQAVAQARSVLEGSGADGLGDALETGIVDLHAFSSIESSVPELVAFLEKALSAGSTYPLFDHEIGHLVSTGVASGVFEPSRQDVGRAKHAALAASLMQRLPTFETASIAEVLQVRQELGRPLTLFRAAVLGFATSIETAAWDDDFAKDAEATFIKDVAPAVQALENEIQQNTFVRKLLGRLTLPTAPIVGGAMLSTAMAKLTDFVQIVGVSVAATTATAAVQAWHDKLQANRKAEQNQLFFYYRARKQLGD